MREKSGEIGLTRILNCATTLRDAIVERSLPLLLLSPLLITTYNAEVPANSKSSP